MQKAPVMKGSGLKPLEEIKADDEVAHVFGKNLEERVVAEDEEKRETISFADVPTHKNREEDDIESIKKRKFDARTGEESEETVFQGDFKLFVWDQSTSNWIEKGRGQLKLNDPIDESNFVVSRLIMRISGTLRIILNVAIRHSTFRVINNSKTSIRFTDSQTVWAASGNNANQLKELIEERLKIAEERAEDEKRRSTSEDEQEKSTTEDEPKKSQSEDERRRSTPDDDRKRSVPDDESSTPPKRSKIDNSCSENETNVSSPKGADSSQEDGSLRDDSPKKEEKSKEDEISEGRASSEKHEDPVGHERPKVDEERLREGGGAKEDVSPEEGDRPEEDHGSGGAVLAKEDES